MAFNTYIFILVFLPIILIGYYLLAHIKAYKVMRVWLVVASVCFYGYAGVEFVFVLILSAITNFLLSCAIQKGGA